VSHRRNSLDYSQYLGPRYWLMWSVLGVARVIAALPWRMQLGLGACFGSVAYHVLKRRREIARVNIKHCFPERSAQAQEQLVKASFRSNGMGLIEALRSWFVAPQSLQEKVRFHGLEHLDAALARGNGVILLGGHFSTLDLVGSLTTLAFKADVLQRDHANPLFNAFMTRSRQSLYGQVISKHDIRSMLRALKRNHIVWYATDQDYGRNGTLFVPFFGVKASCLVSTMKLAKSSGAAVVPFSHFRQAKGGGYDIYLEPALEAFPTNDNHADAQRLNAILESNIRRHPEQYLWMHRRFKTLEKRGDTNIYGQVSG